MTLVHATIDQTGKEICFLADSRLSAPDLRVLTDGAPKLFPVPINVATALPGAKERRAEFGFAYAGSFLASLATHTFASNVAANLLGREGTFPSVSDIADLYARSAALYLSDLENAQFEFFIGGHCPESSTMRLFHIKPMLEDNRWRMQATELNNSHGAVHLMGSGKVAFQRYSARFTTRSQLQMFDSFISRNEGGVGGAVQVALIGNDRVEIPMYARITPGDEDKRTFFNGRDTSEIGSVGAFGIGRTAWGQALGHG